MCINVRPSFNCSVRVACETPDASNLILDCSFVQMQNGLLVDGVYIYTVSVFLLFMYVFFFSSREIVAETLSQDVRSEKRQVTSLSSPYEWTFK